MKLLTMHSYICLVSICLNLHCEANHKTLQGALHLQSIFHEIIKSYEHKGALCKGCLDIAYQHTAFETAHYLLKVNKGFKGIY